MSVPFLAFLVIVAAGIQALVFGYFDLKRLSYRRAFDRDTAVEGERVELIEVIQNAKPLPVPWLRVESRISPHLRFRGDDEREISGERYHKSVFFLPPLSQITRRHQVHCARRGYYALNSVAITAGDLLNLGAVHTGQSLDCALTVHPRLLTDQELSVPCARWQGEVAVRRFIQPDPVLVSGIRDYRAGDNVRDIHWRATARMSALQVKQRDYTQSPRAMVLLNVQTSEAQWGELNDAEQQAIEQGIRIAATLCVRALQAGVEAGFASNGCLFGEKGQGRPVYVPSQRHPAQRQLLLDAMARLVVHRELSFPTFLDALAHLRGEDILILSAYDSDAIQLAMRKLRALGNTCTLVRLEGGRADA